MKEVTSGVGCKISKKGRNRVYNKIAQGDINIFSHFNIRGYVLFEILTPIPEVTL